MSNPLTRLKTLAGAPVADRVTRRIAGMSSNDLVQWTEVAIVGLGRAFGDWQSTANPAVDSLGEARIAAATLQLALDELDRRRAAGVL